jgi:hypothetical protein
MGKPAWQVIALAIQVPTKNEKNQVPMKCFIFNFTMA